MQTIPTLVATSTVGIAAAGLALGRPHNPSEERTIIDSPDTEVDDQTLSTPLPRPGSSATMATPNDKPIQPKSGSSGPYPPQAFYNRPSHAKLDSYNTVSGGRRSSLVQHDESPVEGDGGGARRDSGSSRGSWIRRLSTIPNTQSNSPRSSMGPDSPSLTFSHGSGIPMISHSETTPALMQRNKLVKRAPSGRAVSGEHPRTTKVPTLRRPATSHQRSITLQQQFKEDADEKDPIHRSPSMQAMQSTPPNRHISNTAGHTFCKFFDSRPIKLHRKRSSAGNSHDSISTSNRILPDGTTKAVLVKPNMMNSIQSTGEFYEEDARPLDEPLTDKASPDRIADTMDDPQGVKKRARRSFSMNFSSPNSWVPRSGSLRAKSGGDAKKVDKRVFSAPITVLPGRKVSTSHGPSNKGHRNITDPGVFQKQAAPEATDPTIINDPFTTLALQSRNRNTSSPLPALSRLSSFNLDLARIGASPLISQEIHSAGPQVPITPVTLPDHSSTYYKPVRTKPRISEVTDRASTLVDSDNEMKGFSLGDDDEDFKSETVFDSLRSGATGSMRSHHTTLDAMFDESPPSVDGRSKARRLSVHEIMASTPFRQGNKIIEEDEETSTPVKSICTPAKDGNSTPICQSVEINTLQSSPPNFSLANDYSHLSLEAEEKEEDWTKDDEDDLGNHLSPPISLVNNRRVSPLFNGILPDVKRLSSISATSTSNSERPSSKLFEWSEEKVDPKSDFSRPKTAHADENVDIRGSRTSGRKVPSTAHVRSQSVPYEDEREKGLASKYATWAKGESGEWEDAFDFGIDDSPHDGHKEEINILDRLPSALKDSQAAMDKGNRYFRDLHFHVGNLRRLRDLAREHGLLNGPSALLWKEAEGIIDLAFPPEEDLRYCPPGSPAMSPGSSNGDGDDEDEDIDWSHIDPKYIASGWDGAALLDPELARPSAPFEVLNKKGQPTGLVYTNDGMRKRSVFSSPEDDIFGDGAVFTSSHKQASHARRSHRPSAATARLIVENIHQNRSTSEPLTSRPTANTTDRVKFDTANLKELAHRASVLSRMLADLVRKYEKITDSPDCSPRHDSSPAFTRVFTDPLATDSPKRIPRSHSDHSEHSTLAAAINSSPLRVRLIDVK